MHRISIEITPFSLLGICVACLIIPLNLLLAWTIAVVIHELAHLLILLLCKTPIHTIKIGISGTIIETAPMPSFYKFICAAAGPIASLSLVFLVRQAPLLALCGLFHGLYNLLPLYPSDGWRMLEGLTHCLRLPDKICIIGEIIASVLMVALALFFSIRFHLGALPVYTLLFLLGKQKITCKQRTKKVQ